MQAGSSAAVLQQCMLHDVRQQCAGFSSVAQLSSARSAQLSSVSSAQLSSAQSAQIQLSSAQSAQFIDADTANACCMTMYARFMLMLFCFSSISWMQTLQMQCGTDSCSRWLSETNNSMLVMYPTVHAKRAAFVDKLHLYCHCVMFILSDHTIF